MSTTPELTRGYEDSIRSWATGKRLRGWIGQSPASYSPSEAQEAARVLLAEIDRLRDQWNEIAQAEAVLAQKAD